MERESYLHDRLHSEIVYTRVGVHASYLLHVLRTAMHLFLVWWFHIVLLRFCGFLMFLLFLVISVSSGVLTTRLAMVVSILGSASYAEVCLTPSSSVIERLGESLVLVYLLE